MLRPQLVSWDKLSWKNIQQVNNWNKVTKWVLYRSGETYLRR